MSEGARRFDVEFDIVDIGGVNTLIRMDLSGDEVLEACAEAVSDPNLHGLRVIPLPR